MDKFTPEQTERLTVIYGDMFQNIFEVKSAINRITLTKSELEIISSAIEYCDIEVVGEIMMANIESELKQATINKLQEEENELK
jgi:hypothetical protein